MATLPCVGIARFRHEGLGNSSYLLEVSPGKAVAIDADRSAGRYVREAHRRGWEVVASLDTHLHADFVAGSLELQDLVGARPYLPEDAGVGFAHTGLSPGERVELGDVEIEVRATPGHTPEHLAFVVRGDGPPLLCSGGALIAGGAARTDLIGPGLTEQLTRAEFHTIHEAFADLPDETVLLPTHGAGSFCSSGSKRESTTLGEERATNPLIAETDEERFVREWPRTFPGVPAYFARMRDVNVSGARPTREVARPGALDALAFRDAMEAGGFAIDVRKTDRYAAAHVPGSIAIEFRDAYCTWLGWVVPADASLLFVTDDDVPLERVLEESMLVGYEAFGGWLDGGVHAWRQAGLPLRSTVILAAEELPAELEAGALPLDVREPDEFALGAVAGATLVSLGNLDARSEELSRDRRVIPYCASGLRSATAASILERHGFEDVASIRGGYGAWREAGRD
jgi:hydroxyacylglutathione hydrolase